LAEALELLRFLLATAGASALVSVLASDIPFLNKKPFNCPLCLGFWFGLAFWWMHPGRDGVAFSLAYGCMGALFSWWTFHKITGES